jgi:hypothetical protein
VHVAEGVVLLPLAGLDRDAVRPALAHDEALDALEPDPLLPRAALPLADARDPHEAHDAAAVRRARELGEAVAVQVRRAAEEDRQRLGVGELPVDGALELRDARGRELAELGPRPRTSR